ncbi:MAG: hypothetical protein R3C13_08990 [Hyphomonas sp.]|uniref:hypothetical protein n=1 Tax=Hyphomonas sp. TaxID=87 RepID=UPI003529BE29
MLPLDSPRWKQLTHVYGSAKDIPEMLRRLEALDVIAWGNPSELDDIASALYHQGDPGTASYAAVPHLVGIAEHRTPAEQAWLVYLCSWIEAARSADRPEIPDDLAESYFMALAVARQIAVSLLTDPHRSWVQGEYATDLPYLFSAIAAFDGEHELAQDLAQFELLKDCFETMSAKDN